MDSRRERLRRARLYFVTDVRPGLEELETRLGATSPHLIELRAVSNEIVSHLDWLPTFLAAAGDPNTKVELLEGHQAGDRTFRVHLDGYNLLPYLTGEVEKSPRRGMIYFSDDCDACQDLRVDLTLDDFDRIGRKVPHLADVKPFGRFLELGKRDFYENSSVGLRPFRHNVTYYGIDADQLPLRRPKADVVRAYKRRMDTSLGPDSIPTDHIEALHDLGYLSGFYSSMSSGVSHQVGA